MNKNTLLSLNCHVESKMKVKSQCKLRYLFAYDVYNNYMSLSFIRHFGYMHNYSKSTGQTYEEKQTDKQTDKQHNI